MAQPKMEVRARKHQILQAALWLCENSHTSYSRLTRDQIAARAGCAPTLIAYHFGTMAALRRDIMREAVRAGSLRVIAQGLAVRDARAMKAPEVLRQRAAEGLAS